MSNILDNLAMMKQEQLIFLQRVIETVNSALAMEKIRTPDIPKIIFDISLEELNANTDDVKSLRGKLKELLDEKEKAVDYLINKLGDYQTRYFASSFLGWFGNSGRVAIPRLINLASGHSSAAGAAQKAILFIGGAEEKILDSVEGALRLGDDEIFRNLSTLAVQTDLNKSDVFFEALQRGATHSNPHIREAVADIIGHFQTSDVKRIKSILSLLSSDENQDVRDAALAALDSL